MLKFCILCRAQKNKTAFTLVELLAVIIILGVVLAISIPQVNDMIHKSAKGSFIIDAKALVKKLNEKRILDSSFDVSNVDVNYVSTVLDVSIKNYEVVQASNLDDEIEIAITGKNDWAGLTACGTYENMEIIEGDTCP